MRFERDIVDLAATFVGVLQARAARLQTFAILYPSTAGTALAEAAAHEDAATDIAHTFGLPGRFKFPDETLEEFGMRKSSGLSGTRDCTCTGPARDAHDKECPVRKRNPRLDLGDAPK